MSDLQLPQVLEDIPCQSLGKRFLRILTGLLGRVFLITGGFLLLIPVAIFLLLLAMQSTSGIFEGLPRLLIFALGGVICLVLGRKLRQGKRHLVLYLRKFGFPYSTKAMTFAISTAVGRRWRLVTLDDTVTDPKGGSPLQRRLLWILKWILLITAVLALWNLINWIQGGNLQNIIADTMKRVTEPYRGVELIGAMIVAILVALIIGILVMVLITGLFIIASAIGMAALFSWTTSLAIFLAEHSKKFEIKTEKEISHAVGKIERRAKRIFSPRLIIARVADPIWQKVILALDKATDHIIIDISRPTKNLLWEVTTMQQRLSNNIVYIGEASHLAYLSRPGDDEIRNKIRILLAGQIILAYKTSSKKKSRHFSRALRALLEQSEGGHSPEPAH